MANKLFFKIVNILEFTGLGNKHVVFLKTVNYVDYNLLGLSSSDRKSSPEAKTSLRVVERKTKKYIGKNMNTMFTLDTTLSTNFGR